MRFKKYLIEKTITVNDALKILGVSAEEAADKDKLKSKYRVLSLKNHPDIGGSLEKMKDINNAYELLSKSEIKVPNKLDWENINSKLRSAGSVIKTSLLSNFKPEIFTQYFNELSGYNFFYEIKKVFPSEKERSPSYAGFEVEFFTKDKSTVFSLRIHAELTQIAWPKAELGTDNISYSIMTTAYGFHLNKKQKMSQRDWNFTRDHSFFRKPEQIFPKKKMNDIFSGKTSNRKFKKRDMELFLIKKLGSKFGSGDYVWIPLGEDFSLVIYRSVFMKQAVWMTNGIYRKNTREQMGPIVSFAEEEQTTEIFDKVQKEVMKVKGDAKIKKANDLLKQAYDTYKKSKGI